MRETSVLMRFSSLYRDASQRREPHQHARLPHLMPHQCIECGRTFPDGSKQMLTGCPECGGNKFQFRPEGRPETTSDGSESTSTPASTSPQESTSTTSTVADNTSSAVHESPASTDDLPTSTSATKKGTSDAVSSADDVPVDSSTSTEASSDSTSGPRKSASDRRERRFRPSECPNRRGHAS